MSDFGLHVRFEDQSHSYVHGFEAGQLYQRILDGETLIEGHQVHTENMKTIDAIGVAEGFSVEWQPIDGHPTYSLLTMRKNKGE